MKKHILAVRVGIKAREVDYLYWLQFNRRYVPKSKEKTFNTAIYIRRTGDHREEMQFSA